MQDPFTKLFDKRLLMVTGKGGIGKTLCSVALAYRAQAQGKKVCLVESSAHDQLSPLFGAKPVGHQQRVLAPGITVINVNPQDNFRDFVIKHLGFAKLFEKVFTKPLVRSFVQMMPGIAELTLLGRLYYYCELDREDNFDLVILDGFASGHFMSLMKTPDAVLHSGMVGPIVEETQRVRAYINDPAKTGVVLVTVPEDLVISEALDFTERMQLESPAHLSAVIINRCFPAVPTSEPTFTPALKAGFEYWKSRTTAEARSIDRLRSGLAQLAKNRAQEPWPIYTLEERGAFDEPLAAAELDAWLGALAAI